MKSVFFATAISGLCLASCSNPTNPKSAPLAADTLANDKSNSMKSYIAMFEIPADEISRAVNFYQAILDIKIETMEIPEMQLGIFPYEGQMVSGVIIKAEGYKPSANGVTIYINGGDDLQNILDKVEKNGGKVLTPKTPHADGNGYFALFFDSEGNKVGLNSPN